MKYCVPSRPVLWACSALSVPAGYPCTVVLGSAGKKLLGIIPGAMEKKAYLRKIGELTGIVVPE